MPLAVLEMAPHVLLDFPLLGGKRVGCARFWDEVER